MIGINLNTVMLVAVTAVVFFLAWFGLPLTIFGAAVLIGLAFMLLKLFFKCGFWWFKRQYTQQQALIGQEHAVTREVKQDVPFYTHNPFEQEESGRPVDSISVHVDFKNGQLYVNS